MMKELDAMRLATELAQKSDAEMRKHVDELFNAIENEDLNQVKECLSQLQLNGQWSIEDLRHGKRTETALNFAIRYAFEQKGIATEGNIREQIVVALIDHYQVKSGTNKAWAIDAVSGVMTSRMPHLLDALWKKADLDHANSAVHRKVLSESIRWFGSRYLDTLLKYPAIQRSLRETDGVSNQSLGDVILEEVVQQVNMDPQLTLKWVRCLEGAGVDIHKPMLEASENIMVVGAQLCVSGYDEQALHTWCSGLVELGFDPLMRKDKIYWHP